MSSEHQTYLLILYQSYCIILINFVLFSVIIFHSQKLPYQGEYLQFSKGNVIFDKCLLFWINKENRKSCLHSVCLTI